jgi:hypothetical protein
MKATAATASFRTGGGKKSRVLSKIKRRRPPTAAEVSPFPPVFEAAVTAAVTSAQFITKILHLENRDICIC